MVADNKGLAGAVARRFKLPAGVELDDVVSAAVEGLCRAARTFDPARGVKFSTFGWRGAYLFARKYVVDQRGGAVRHPVAWKSVPATVPFSAAGAEGDGDFAATVADPGPRPDPPDEVAFWEEVAEALPDERWRLVLRRRHVDGRKYAEIAAELGVTTQRALQIEQKALEALREQKKLFERFLDG